MATSMTGPNVDLLRKTLAHIEANPETWYQAEWIADIEGATENDCGTAYCFGGWAAVLHGATVTQDDNEGWDVYASPPPGETVACNEEDRAEEDDGLVYISLYAREVLGLTREQGDRLFVEHNTLDDLRRIVAEICDSAAAVAS